MTAFYRARSRHPSRHQGRRERQGKERELVWPGRRAKMRPAISVDRCSVGVAALCGDSTFSSANTMLPGFNN